MFWFKKYKLLLWKNFTLQKRRPISSIFEIMMPILFIFILLILRITDIKSQRKPVINWKGLPLDNTSPFTNSSMRKWKIAYTKNSSYFELMSYVPDFLHVDIQSFENESILVDKLVTDEENPNQSYLCGVLFDSDIKDSEITYRLRFPSTPRTPNGKESHSSFSFIPKKWYTQFVFPLTFEGMGPRNRYSDSGGPPPYYNNSFLSIQRAVDFAIVRHHNKSFKASDIGITMRRFPYPSRIKDPFIVVIQNSLPWLIMLSLVYTSLVIVRDIVYEKEKKLKESMKMMGLSGWLHWAACFTKCFVFLLIPMSVVTIMMCVKFGGYGKMLIQSDGLLIFVFFLMYSITSIMFCFFVSTLFYKANLAAAGGGILWFLLYTPYFFLTNYYDQMSTMSKTLACLDFQIAMSFGSNLIGRFEGEGSGVQWSNINKGVTVDQSFTFGHVLFMFFIDSLIYGLLAWYIEGIFPGEYGIPKKWYFPFSRKYWCNIQETDEEVIPLVNNDFGDDNEREIHYIDSTLIEKEPEGLKAGIRINNLSKRFKVNSETKVAVDSLNLNLYEGEITALLGHNGAGKTTTISMLTGLIPPTSGNAIINGYDVLNNMAGIRQSLGICPQHNVLFDNLTVEEHLIFFTSLKGIDGRREIQEEVDRMIESIGLPDKRHVRGKMLSGGMKRKLSVGIALVGNSKIIMLDEPTSGMDVSARRFTWDLLQRERHGRTILLTTHFMDEADVLGDRIAIMANGKIKCCGSSLFLKNKYGCGYHMVMVKKQNCDVNVITDLIKYYVPSAIVESNVGLELSIILPSDFSHQFEKLFTEIESRQEELGISSYGASVTTLEEVFIKVGEEAEHEENTHKELFRQLSGQKETSRFVPGEHAESPLPKPSSRTFDNDDELVIDTYMKNAGYRLKFQRWYAMFVKKMLHSKRHKASIISQLMMPCLFVLIALIVVKTMPKESDSPALTLDVNMFGENYVAYNGKGSSAILKNLMVAIPDVLKSTDSHSVHVDDKKHMQDYLLEQADKDLAVFNLNHPIAIQLNSNDKKNVSITAWFNNEAYHTPAVAVNTITNAILHAYTNNSALKIVAVNDPLPTTTKEGLNDLSINPNGFQIGFSLCFGMSFLASSFVLFLVQERSTKAKHVQFVSGVDPISYWTSTFAWDLFNFVFPTVLVMILYLVFQEDAYSGTRLGYVFILMMLYGWAIIPFMYMFSFAFEVPSTAFTRMTILNVITGLATMLVVFILSIPSLNLLDVAKALKWAFLVVPNYNLGQGMIDLFNNYQSIEIFNKAVASCEKSYHFDKARCENLTLSFVGDQLEFETNYLAWANPGIGRYLVFLALEGFLFFFIVLIIEYEIVPRFFRQIVSGKARVLYVHKDGEDPPLDSDVQVEQTRIQNQNRGNDVLMLKDLTKVYRSLFGENFLAVDRVSLGVAHGECFGLLGQNGAGKTTTFKMLTGDESITAGSAYIDSFDVSIDTGKIRQRMGYCPQFDALVDLLTGRELLTMYSRLRGIPEKSIPRIVENLAKALTVDKYIDKVTKTYSGGNKRKLSTAIALIGDPSLIFLDEPSAGMDPVARRMLWDALSRVIASGKSIVITSHSMEECEALCTRIAIMVNGQFKCLGSPQHLRTKFGEGYTLICRVAGLQPDTQPLKDYIANTFPGSTLKDEHQGYLHYQLIAENKTWANLFGIMEQAKKEFNIEDYSVSQTTLEQVFMNFTRAQRVVEE